MYSREPRDPSPCPRSLIVGRPTMATTLHSDDSPLVRCLSEIHAVEQLDLRLLQLGSTRPCDRVASEIYAGHCTQTRGHLRLIAERLAALDAPPGSSPEGRVRGGALGIELDVERELTPAELAISVYTLENLEIGLYHVLSGLARRSHDLETLAVAQHILEEEEDAAELVAGTIDRADYN